MRLTHGQNAQDGLDVYAEEIFRAVGALKEVTWEAIRRERFFLTPKGFFDELVRNAQAHMNMREHAGARIRMCPRTYTEETNKRTTN